MITETDVLVIGTGVAGLTAAMTATRHGQVIVASLNAQLERVFKITNLDRIFTFFPDRDAALGQPAGAPM